MNMIAAYTEAQILSAQTTLHPDWQYDAARPALKRTFVFADFNQAFGFMSRVALYAALGGDADTTSISRKASATP